MRWCYHYWKVFLHLPFYCEHTILRISTVSYNNKFHIHAFIHSKIILNIFLKDHKVYLKLIWKITHSSKFTINIERTIINIFALSYSPFHDTWLFLTHIINSLKAIIAWYWSFSSFSVEYIVLESSCILKGWRYEKSIITCSKVFFHNSLKIRSIFHNIKTRSLSLSTDKVSNENSAIFLIHFTDFNRSINLNYFKSTISTGPSYTSFPYYLNLTSSWASNYS